MQVTAENHKPAYVQFDVDVFHVKKTVDKSPFASHTEYLEL